MMELRIFLDVDEVLVDFVGGVLRLYGWDREQYKQAHRAGTWDMTPTLGISHEELRQEVSMAGEKFWADLERHPWAVEMLDCVKEMTDDWYLLSSPFLDSRCFAGKFLGVLRNFGDEASRRIILTQHKHLFAQSAHHRCVLIDDREKSVEKFILCGGQGIVFPSLQNTLYYMSHDPVPYIRKCLKELSNVPIQKCQ